MLVGTAHLDITPPLGIDLTGFAVRQQPSTSILDRLAVRALYLEDGPERLLWLNADLLAIEDSLAEELRQAVGPELGIPVTRILLTATHTHSGPATIHLTGCGEYDARYVSWVKGQFLVAARLAVASREACELVAAEGMCSLGVDRRDRPSAHTDPRVLTLGWRRPNGTFKAAFLNYSMHPVCLSGVGISADWPGEAARILSQSLPGRPTVLVASGACGNVNPPLVGVTPAQMLSWGRQVAESALPGLLAAPPIQAAAGPLLGAAAASVPLPLEGCDAAEVAKYAAQSLADTSAHLDFSDKFRVAVETWREAMTARAIRGAPRSTNAEISVVALGPITLLTVSAEIFSHFNELIDGGGERSTYAIGCTNGMIGYLAPETVYGEGGYEVEQSMLFYNMPRLKRGGLELLAEHARRLVRQLNPWLPRGDAVHRIDSVSPCARPSDGRSAAGLTTATKNTPDSPDNLPKSSFGPAPTAASLATPSQLPPH